MSNNLISRQFPVSDSQMVEVHVSDKMDLPVSDAQMRMMGHGPGATLQQFAVSNGQLAFTESLSSGSVSQNGALLNSQRGHVDPRLGFQGSQQFLTPHQNFGEMGTFFNTPGPPTSLLSVKRKAEVEPVGSLSVSQQSGMPNKRAAQAGTLPHSAGSLQPHVTNKKGLQMQSKLSSPTVQNQAANRKMQRNDSVKSGSQRVQTPKGQTVQIGSASKVSSESSGGVRSKMRESLASALELACQNQDKSVNEEKDVSESASHQNVEISRPPESSTGESGTSSDKCENIQNTFPPHESSSLDGSMDGQIAAPAVSTSENVGETRQGFKDFQCGSVLTTEDFSFTDNFFIKDELLQGNGLSWAWELDMSSRDASEVGNDVRPDMLKEDAVRVKDEPARPSAQDLAIKIEEELFKLFGGVNKKYKEKGRSLLFNLKDRNNPELRERVMSGEISPEKLCSMTAEELASKELSQWRMAKAEELAQMVVLPETDMNMMRRMVRKTHKGEFQVEVEKNDDVAAEVVAGTSSVVLPQRKESGKRALPSEGDMKEKENVTVERSGGENQSLSGRLVIPNDGTDLMQGMIVDEMKDAEFLPPIVSLDEFMESLNTEPPFESLPVEAGQTTPRSDKKNAREKSASSDLPSKVPAGTLSDKAKEIKEHKDTDKDEKSKQSPLMEKVTAFEMASKVGCLWEGSLQLSISSSVTVLGVLRSGERTTTQEWSASLEVKGRVRLDAFEKFLQGLPMSRSRAVMVLHFLLKDNASEDERASLSEAVESYISDERLGFAEPATGVELYLCPPGHARILDMLCKHLNKDRAELVDSTDNGLIGVVVWRRTQPSSAVSPNSSSQNKGSLKRQQHVATTTSSRRQSEKDTYANGNITPKGPPMAFGQPRHDAQDDDGDDDDIPPGFGPGAPRDEDDLPEFNFSGNVNQSVNRVPSQNLPRPSRFEQLNRPADQMRELVKKYGQTTTVATPSNRGSGVGIGLEPWDDDDDDDIPEWRPQVPPHGFQQPVQTHGVMRAPVVGQHVTMLPQHLHANAASGPGWQQNARWGHPSRSDSSHVSLGNRPSSGQPNGMPARP